MVRKFVRNLLNVPSGYEFIPAKSINKQNMEFVFRQSMMTIEADYTTPLYETITEVVDYDCYQLDKMNFNDSDNGVILDIGANIGVSAIVFSKVHKGRILCFEPMENNCFWLESNIKRNTCENIEVFKKAVTKINGKVNFTIENNNSVSGKVTDATSIHQGINMQNVEVDSVNLKNIIESLNGNGINLIKMDCEGGEYDIIDQIDYSIAQSIFAISLEVHNLNNTLNLERIVSKLKDLGYQTFVKKERYGRNNLHYLLGRR